MIPKLIATDLDGTLLRNDRTVSERTLRALRAATEAGVEVVFVTARPPRFVDELAAGSGLSGTAVCSNGALVYDVGTRTVLKSRTLPPEDARKVAEALTGAVGGVGFAVETGHKVVFAPGYGHRLPEDAEAEFPVDSVEALWSLDAPFVKLLAWSAQVDADTMLATAESAAGGKAQFTHSGGSGLLEVSASGVTKAGTLSALCAERGIDAADVIAFGDMPNDLTILEWAGTAYAMGNAHASVRAAVTRHTASNEEDGVATVLEQFVTVG
ncbi:Cof-type HAD-IIB family hydrolase [Streptomyces canus]|uniref:HAD family hydrolase n=1 Tax=Streptomyces canus TaxID=58343 RepID=UPI002E2B9DD3|nr:HAD family hydrolase [Streptomyces canus]